MPRKPSGRPNGRPKGSGKTINWEQAEQLAHMQCTQEEIASFFHIDVNTLKDITKREKGEVFSQWLKKNAENGRCSLRRSLWLQATDPEKPSAAIGIWLSKNYLGMKDTVEHDVSDKAFNLAYSLNK